MLILIQTCFCCFQSLAYNSASKHASFIWGWRSRLLFLHRRLHTDGGSAWTTEQSQKMGAPTASLSPVIKLIMRFTPNHLQVIFQTMFLLSWKKTLKNTQ